MTLPATPLPKIRSLLQAATAPVSRGEPWRQDNGGGNVSHVYWRGSFALAAGVEAVRKAAGADHATVWIPGYFCNEALDPIRRLPMTLRFYPVLADLTPDWEALKKLGEGKSGAQVFVLVHYFGFPNATIQAKAFCSEYNLTLMEDAAHVLRPGGGIGVGNLSIFSPRKLLAVPSGGILVASKDLATHLAGTQFNQRRKKDTIIWLGKRLAQRSFVRLHVPWHRFPSIHQEELGSSSTDEVGSEFIERCIPFDLKLLTVMGQHLDEVTDLRRCHYQQLLGWINDLVGGRPLFNKLPEGICPYAFPLVMEEGSAKVAARLQSWGIPAYQWPDLPPEVLASEGDHKISISTYEQLILLPLHHTLTTKQIDTVGRRLRQAVSDGGKT